ncbi:hypothetical protein H0H81_002474, partial [Sphagnurus paluster]
MYWPSHLHRRHQTDPKFTVHGPEPGHDHLSLSLFASTIWGVDLKVPVVIKGAAVKGLTPTLRTIHLDMSTQHGKEPTAFSLTDTVVDRGDGRPRPDLANAFSESTITGRDDDRNTVPKETLTPPDPRFTPAIIPPEHSHRTLILCFDGTGDQFDDDNSNIVQLVSLLKKNDRSKQMVYYQAGIGTYTSPKVVTPFASSISKASPRRFGGYEFLMQNYIEGDKICIFGFSRGAYTARSLAGMIHKVGLLPADNHQQVPFAYKMYTRADDMGWQQSNGFKLAFSVDVDIEFLGVWDTVDSVGLFPKRLPFTTSNTIVRTFRHAVALDERRAKFKANLWNRPNADEQQYGVQPPPQPPVTESPKPIVHVKQRSGTLPLPKLPTTMKPQKHKETVNEEKLSNFERVYSQKARTPTDIEEVWFAVGLRLIKDKFSTHSHCSDRVVTAVHLFSFNSCLTLLTKPTFIDVGGGSIDNKTPHALSRISLRWMIRECFKAKTGIMFDAQALRGIGLEPSRLFPEVLPRPPPLASTSEILQKIKEPSTIERIASKFKKKKSEPVPTVIRPVFTEPVNEELEDLLDCLSPKYDQLQIKRSWWVLELIPLNLRYQNSKNEWVSHMKMNRARPRFIPKQQTNGIKIHRTVKQRMEAKPPKDSDNRYKPKPELT